MHSAAAEENDSRLRAFSPLRAARYLLDVIELEADVGGMLPTRPAAHFSFRATDYYAGLIDWDDPADPIRKLIVPSDDELLNFGSSDASNEAANTVVPGLQHKYRDTALLLVTDQCAGFCRYCFRKRLFSRRNRETLRDWRPALRYIRRHTEITDVLLTGGDPLTLPTAALRELVQGLLVIPHVRTIRIGSKMPAFNPGRITDDPKLARLVASVVATGRSLYVMTHFDHCRELTSEAVEAVAALKDAGATCVNQCPITAGVNDDPAALADLLQCCTEVGCPQYYVFQCRPTRGNKHFVVPLMRALEVIEDARQRVSGLARRARFCASHESGKIEIVGADQRYLYARYHRAKCSDDEGRMLVYHRDDQACWIDELVPRMRPW